MGLSAADLGDGEALAIAVAHRAQPGEEIGDLGLALVVEMALEIERPRADMAVVGRGRIVAQRGVAHREVDRVELEAIDAAFAPEPSDLKQCLLHRRVAPVELRLCAPEIVQIIFDRKSTRLNYS